MDIFQILELIGGLSLFLFGMHLLGDGLTSLSSGRLEQLLAKFTSTKLKAVLLGAIVTSVIQSSSATTVMVVALVNSGVLKLAQAVPLIMGANIGTTITPWILSLTTLTGDSILIRMLQPSNFTPLLALIGVLLLVTSKKERRRSIAFVLLGFTVLMYGMSTMSSSVSALRHNPSFTRLFTIFSNPILGIALGAIVTAIIQSSSASVGILQALSSTGAINFSSAFPIIMGQNIGTCVTALIASIGSNRNAKRTAFIHLTFNFIGTIVFTSVFYFIHTLQPFAFMEGTVTPVNIAILHTVFNVVTSLWMLPFSDYLVKFSKAIVREKEDTHGIDLDEIEGSLRLLDMRFITRPGVAIQQSREVLVNMVETASKAFNLSLGLFENYNEDIYKQVELLENQVDTYEDRLSEYCANILGKELSPQDSQSLTFALHTINDVERISDHAINLADQARLKHNANKAFTEEAMQDLRIYKRAVEEIVSKMASTFTDPEARHLVYISPLEDRINELHSSFSYRHIERVKKGLCNMENGMIISEIYNNLERIADHCSNIGVYRIQFTAEKYRTHEYEKQLDKSQEYYRSIYDNYKIQYAIADDN